ncbi:type VI secretion system baseplate subunit TssG [Trinickia terrae]|uniref:Type VI secretion system baseplate subunit TssG n=1 Tax=Trinickia terrae TaxID=2571161 RepID=A0A4V5PJZ2_9BURK|nr:type VI secretion system baseplate subunit TssG [Trinickia terrae]TKC78930.1 type VI secretion system baseplate subunit TssG [Trinickia terrae]
MNAHDIPDLEPLVGALLARAPHMNFFQLCQLLELQAPGRAGFGTLDSAAHEPVRFRPHSKTGFPASEVAAVEFDDERPCAPPTVRTTFLGLYGVNAAMPSHLIDDIVLRREGHDAVMAFLDQFNHRVVTLLYRGWKKYRYPVGFRAGGTDERSRDLLCLAGFGIGDKAARAGLPDSRVLAIAGLLNQRTRTAEGLAGVVALAVPGVDVKVDEFHPMRIKVSEPKGLGSRGRATGDGERAPRGLGSDYVLGRRIAYRSKAVRVTLRASSADHVNGLLPDAPLHRDLMAFLRIYVGVKADVMLRMDVPSELAPLLELGATRARPGDAGETAHAHASRLGWTSVLKPAPGRTLTIPIGRYEAFPKTISRARADLNAAHGM